MRQSDRKRRVRRQNELRVALPPVSADAQMSGCDVHDDLGKESGEMTDLIHAMLTGADAVAWKTMAVCFRCLVAYLMGSDAMSHRTTRKGGEMERGGSR